MPIVLFRVDERLIHGQVVIAWGERLHPTRYLIVDDHLVASPWEQELYRLSAGETAVVEFHGAEGARGRLEGWRQDPQRSVLLTRDLDTMVHLAQEGGLRGESVNLGGIHHAEGRSRVRPYLYLGTEERQAIRELEAEGVSVSARDLPDGTAVGASVLLAGD